MTDRIYIPTRAGPERSGLDEWIFKAATIWNNRLSSVSDAADTAQTTAETAQASATAAIEQVPATGDFRMIAGTSYGDEWLLCDGSAVSRTTYSDLFEKIGTTYGAGDTFTTFNLPTVKAFILDNGTGFSLDTMEKSTWNIVIRT